MCNAEPPADSPLAKLMLAEDRLVQLTTDSGIEKITRQFDEFRELLWDVIEGSADPSPFTQAWNMINLYAKVDLLDFEQGNTSALFSMQEKVQEAIKNLP